MQREKGKKLSVQAKLANATQLPIDMAVRMPYIKLFSNREAVIEDAGKLIHYDEECVKVRQQKNTVVINGGCLKLVYLVNNDLKVTGFISCIGFE